MSLNSHGEEDSPATRRLGTLICPSCGFEEPYDGDWIVDDGRAGGHRRIECPACEAVVVRQPVFRPGGPSEVEPDGRTPCCCC